MKRARNLSANPNDWTSPITLKSGVELTPDQAKEALDQAMAIIGLIGTVAVGTGDAYLKANRWMKTFYPQWA